VEVIAIEPLDDEPFDFEGTLPTLPRTIRPRGRRSFLVGMIRDAVAEGPYFRVTLVCDDV
jgi:hypothetical protein